MQRNNDREKPLLEFLLRPKLARVTTCPFAAVRGTRGKTSVALATDLLITLVLRSKDLHGWFNDATTKTKDEMKSGLLLDIVITQCSSVFKLLSSENETLLVRRNSFLILNFCFDIVDRVRGLNLESDRLSR